MVLNIHTHNPAPDTSAVIDISGVVYDSCAPFSIPDEYAPGQLFSVGIHPWNLAFNDVPDGLFEAVRATAELPNVGIIGEAGLDLLKGGPLYRQMQVFKFLIELSEELRKPLLIHDVKAHDMIIGLHRDLNPAQPWIIHGFRKKHEVAEMFLKAGIYISFGEIFNNITVHNMPCDRILAETDESEKPITEIIHSLSDAYGTDLTRPIAENTARLLTPK